MHIEFTLPPPFNNGTNDGCVSNVSNDGNILWVNAVGYAIINEIQLNRCICMDLHRNGVYTIFHCEFQICHACSGPYEMLNDTNELQYFCGARTAGNEEFMEIG